MGRGWPEFKYRPVQARPPVELLSAIDHGYRREASADALPLVESHASEDRKAPVIQMRPSRDPRRYAFGCKGLFDGVGVVYQNEHRGGRGNAIAVAAKAGIAAVKRVVGHCKRACNECCRNASETIPVLRGEIVFASALSWIAVAGLAAAPVWTEAAFVARSSTPEPHADSRHAEYLDRDLRIGLRAMRSGNTVDSASSTSAISETTGHIELYTPDFGMGGLSARTRIPKGEGDGPIVRRELVEQAYRPESALQAAEALPERHVPPRIASTSSTVKVSADTLLRKLASEESATSAASGLPAAASMDTEEVRHYSPFRTDAPIEDNTRLISSGVNASGAYRHWAKFTFQPLPSLSLTTQYSETDGTIKRRIADAKRQDGVMKMRLDYSPKRSGLTFYSESETSLDDLENPDLLSRRLHLNVGASWMKGPFSLGGRHGFGEMSRRDWFKSMDMEQYNDVSELWGTWRIGRFNVKARWADIHTASLHDESSPEENRRETDIELDYAFSEWPYLGANFSWTRTTNARSNAVSKARAEEYQKTVVGLGYENDKRNVWWHSNYSAPTGSGPDGAQVLTSWYHYLTAYVRPVEAIRLNTTMGYSDDRYPGLHARTTGKSMSWNLVHEPKIRDIKFTAYGTYVQSKTEAWNQAFENYNLGGFTEWMLGDSHLGPMQLSFGVAYTVSKNISHPELSSDSTALWVLYTVGSPSRLRIIPGLLESPRDDSRRF